MSDNPLANLRQDYVKAEFSEASAQADAIEQFKQWFADARQAEVLEPNAMTVATVGADGRPSARIVLLKELDAAGGFVFYTNYQSRKADELAKNAHIAACFWWGPLERQVRIEGAAEKVSRETSDEYFRIRPRLSQLGAWVSDQSRPITSRAALDDTMATLQRRFEGQDIPLPPHWGGYRIEPASIEFWQGRRSRLHDRLLYTRRNDQSWDRVRLSP